MMITNFSLNFHSALDSREEVDFLHSMETRAVRTIEDSPIVRANGIISSTVVNYSKVNLTSSNLVFSNLRVQISKRSLQISKLLSNKKSNIPNFSFERKFVSVGKKLMNPFYGTLNRFRTIIDNHHSFSRTHGTGC